MESVLRNKYDLLDFKRGEPIPYLFTIRVDNLYVFDYRVEKRTVNQIANDRDLPKEVVRQAIEWCTENDDLITKVLAKERKEAGFKD